MPVSVSVKWLVQHFFSPFLREIGSFINLGLDTLPFTLPPRYMIYNRLKYAYS